MIQSSEALGHDLADVTIDRSSFLISIFDGNVKGKGKAEKEFPHLQPQEQSQTPTREEEMAVHWNT